MQVALVQSGITTASEASGIMTLGSLFYEPVWLFWRSKEPLTSLAQFRGKRIAGETRERGPGGRAAAAAGDGIAEPTRASTNRAAWKLRASSNRERSTRRFS